MFRHILLIKNNRIFVNHLQWCWIRHHVFDWFISLINVKVFCLFFLLSEDFCYSSLICFIYTPFFYQSQEDKKVDVKQCQKLRSKLKESFFKLVHFLSKSIYLYIYTLYHIAFGHFILLTVLFSSLTIFFLSEFSFESFIILFVAVFTYHPTTRFQS